MKRNRVIGIIMLIAAAIFIAYALLHPEASFAWSNSFTYALYAVYLVFTVILLKI